MENKLKKKREKKIGVKKGGFVILHGVTNRPKWRYTPFVETFQQNTLYLKLFRDMPLF